MKSKTSFFNRTLFLNTLKRFWPLFSAYLLIWIIILPVSLNGVLSWASKEPENNLIFTASTKILYSGTYLAPIMASIFGLLFAIAAFSYLYNSRSVSMVCALPYKRESVFLSQFSTGFVGLFASNIIVFLLTVIVESSYGALEMSYLWQWLGLVSLNCLFFYGFAVFCASLTSNIFVLPFVYLVLNFTIVVVEFFARIVLRGVYYGISSSTNPVLSFLSPLYELLINSGISELSENAADGTYTFFGYYFNNWTTLIIYGAVGIVFSVLALILIKHRRMETVGDVVAVKPLKPIFKYCMSFGCALVLSVIINSAIFYDTNNKLGYGSISILLGCMVFGAFIGYFASEMLMQKTLRVFAAKNWIGLGVSCLVIITLTLSCEFDIFGFERKTPVADDVESVSIYGSFSGITFEDPDNIQSVTDLHKNIISNKDIYENITNKNMYNARHSLNIEYSLKNGKVLSRYYDLCYDITDDCNTLNDIINCSEAINYRKHIDIPLTESSFSIGYIAYMDSVTGEYQHYELSSEETIELYYDCIVPDIEAGALGNVWLDADYSKVNGKSYYSTVYDCEIYFELSQRTGEIDYIYDSFQTFLTVDAENTLAWFEKQGIKPTMLCPKPDTDKYSAVNSSAIDIIT